METRDRAGDSARANDAAFEFSYLLFRSIPPIIRRLKRIPDAVDLWQHGSTRCVLKRVVMPSAYQVCLYDGVALTKALDFDDRDRAIAFAVELFRWTHREPLA